MNFKKIVDRIIEVTGYAQKDVANEVFNIKANNLSNRIKRNSVDVDKLIDWASDNSVNLNWLLTGKGEPYLSAVENGSKFQNIVELEHLSIVKTFKNKSLAKELNEILKKIEDIDGEHLREVKGLLRSELSRLQGSVSKKTSLARK
ncbi:hypothetical protein DSCO28_50840 [Desulfosarcina ovata subsp. sediminis]|uniref:Bacteriophage CI repressor N-terminal domain-containing protein n=1 Tax=Desulfosarcina ovata subsp. sediminis TaxID=885957 RepID=A0A5K7ZWB7_9BACT|nr:helix-turn-helix domain-containing protein [Desulfosarcina ovata]BBO84518.1 hypothetical protein DSCO28_50840 [Desulfosarcina ovata subsp. sediminis]